MKRQKKNILTLFPYPLMDVHLLKDVGMVPYWLAKITGSSATLTAPPPETSDLPTLTQLSPELSFSPLSSSSRLSRLRSVITHARTTDLLILFFWGPETFALGLLYKRLNPKGKIYVKTDLNTADLLALKGPKSLVKRTLENQFVRTVDCVSAESSVSLDGLRSAFPELGKRLILIPNGVDDRWLDAAAGEILPWSQKENLAITVGRIGLFEKDHETLLEALEQINLGDWKFAFVGPIVPAFAERLARFQKKYPEKADRVYWAGAVPNRTELARWFQKAKLFVLSSRSESFGITLVEALCFGQRLLVSDQVTSAPDLVLAGKQGLTHRSGDPRHLAEVLEKMMGDPDLANKTEGVAENARSRYRWSSIVEPLAQVLLVPER